jgi:uncharacterized membrane protein
MIHAQLGSLIAVTAAPQEVVHMNLTPPLRLGLALGFGALAGVAAITLVRSRRRDDSGAARAADPSYASESVTINQPIERVYQAWMNLDSIGFMRNTRITDAAEQDRCTWTSDDGTTGVVRFQRAPGARGTEIHIELMGISTAMTSRIARVLGMAPDQQVREDLRRFKQLMEAGEVTLSDGPGLWRPAQPPASVEQLTAFAGV